jgi:hypothetical protein
LLTGVFTPRIGAVYSWGTCSISEVSSEIKLGRSPKDLEHAEQLSTLDLNGTAVTGAGLKNFTNLTDLRLGCAPVTDAGVRELKNLKLLARLDLGNTALTDAGVKELKGLGNLTRP